MDFQILILLIRVISQLFIWIVIASSLLSFFVSPYHPVREARWKMDFYYPNFQNDMWRIFGLVFFADKDYFVAAGGKAFKEGLIRDFLQEKGIAISDTAYQVVRLQGNASVRHCSQ